jgi:hypothetical protein
MAETEAEAKVEAKVNRLHGYLYRAFLPVSGTLHRVFLKVWATELLLVQRQIQRAVQQIYLHSATGEWLDIWRDYTIGGGRTENEADEPLRQRIITTLLRKKCNNVAIEEIVKAETGLDVRVEDIPWRKADGSVDQSVVAKYGLRRRADGKPAWGRSGLLQCAFAVIFKQGSTCADRKRVLSVIHRVKAAGTYPLTYREARMLRTNIPDEVSNHDYWVTGPLTSDFVLWECFH